MKRLLFLLITIFLLSCCGSINSENKSHNQFTPDIENYNKKTIVFFDPSIYETTESHRLTDIYSLVSEDILSLDKLSHNNEFIFWLIDDQMPSNKKSYSIKFERDKKTGKREDQFPLLLPCLKEIDTIISNSWKSKHTSPDEIKKPTSCIIESLYILNSNYSLDENTEIVFITDMLQESTEYKMNLEKITNRELIKNQFERTIKELKHKGIIFNFSKVNSFTIYRARSNKIATIEKAQAIKDCWTSFFINTCKIDSTKIKFISMI